MENVRPVYKKVLIAAIVIYIIGVTFILTDIYMKVGKIEDKLMHLSSASQHKH